MRALEAFLLAALVAFSPEAHAAHSTAFPTPLAPEQVVDLRLAQQEINVDVADAGSAVTAGMGGGLLGALIGVAVNNAAVSNAEERIGPMRNLMLGYDFNARFEKVLRGNLSRHISPSPRIFTEHSLLLASDPERPTGVPTEGVLVITPTYAVSQNFETLKVMAKVVYARRHLDSKGRLREKNLLYRTYAWNYQLPPKKGSGATEDATRWLEFSAAQLSAMIDNGIVQTVDLINYDFSPEGRDESTISNRGKAAVGSSMKLGRKVRDQGGGVVLRTGNSSFQSLNGYVPATAELPAAALAIADDLGESSAVSAGQQVDAAAPAKTIVPGDMVDGMPVESDVAKPSGDGVGVPASGSPADVPDPAVP